MWFHMKRFKGDIMRTEEAREVVKKASKDIATSIYIQNYEEAVKLYVLYVEIIEQEKEDPELAEHAASVKRALLDACDAWRGKPELARMLRDQIERVPIAVPAVSDQELSILARGARLCLYTMRAMRHNFFSSYDALASTDAFAPTATPGQNPTVTAARHTQEPHDPEGSAGETRNFRK